MKPTENLTPQQVNKSLRFSFVDGLFACSMTGFTQDYFTPFLLLLGGGAAQVGILNSLPNFAAAVAQLKSADLTEKVGSRKSIINIFVFLQASILILLAMLAWQKITSPSIFIILVMLFTALGAFAVPAWGSLMADLVDEKRRGEYFGWRNRFFGFTLVGMSFVAGALLHHWEKLDIYAGFTLLFASAAVFRFVSWHFLNRMYEPRQDHKKEDYFNLFMFLRRIRESNFAKFVLFVALFNFCVNLASPFFAVYMLRDLKFNYLTYSLVTVTATLMIYLLMGRWGRHADKVGNLKILRISAPIIATLPVWWVFNQHPVYLLAVQCLSGFAWAGFNLCASNFILDAVSPPKRTRCIAYFNVLNGLALCAGALLGGFLSDRLPMTAGYSLLTLFILSASLRMVVALTMPRLLKEVRPVDPVNSVNIFFSMLKFKPITGVEQRNIRF